MKVAIIGGGGRVGSCAAFALQCSGIVKEILMLDANQAAAEGEALDLLHHISTEKRCPLHSLGAWFPNPGRLRKLLLALQMAGWTDLLRTEDGWIYIVRSTEADEVAAILGDGEEETEPAEEG